MRAVKLLLALLLFVLGAGLIAVGISAIQTFGSEGRLNLESPVLESGRESHALVIDVADVDTGLPLSEQFGETTIGARSTDQSSLFVGLAATPDLDEYLRGIPYDVVRNEGSGWKLSTVPGTQKPDPPRAEQFWTRRGTGSEPTIPFKQAPGGKTTFVTMNSDGGSGVAAVMTVGYRSSVVFPLSVGSIGLGIVLVLLAVSLAFRSRKKRKHAGNSEEPPSTPVPSGGTAIPSGIVVTGEAVATGGGPDTASVGLPPEPKPAEASIPKGPEFETAVADEAQSPASGSNDKDENAIDTPTHTKPATDDEDVIVHSGGADSGGADSGGADSGGADSGGADSPSNESSADESETGDADVNEPNESRDTRDTAMVNSDSTDTADYDSWFRDGKTK